MEWFRRRAQGQSGFVSIGVVLAVVAAMVAFTFGQGTTHHVLRLLPGGTWLLNKATATVSHVNGSTGKKDGEWAIKLDPGQTAQRLMQVNGSIIAIDSEGNAHIIDAAKGSNQQTTQAFGRDYELFVGDAVVYSIQRSTGDVQARSGVAGGLAPLGATVNVAGPIDSGTVNNTDKLLATVPEDGVIASVDRTTWTAAQEFTPNTPTGAVQVTTMQGRGVLVNAVEGVAKTLEGPAATVRFDPQAVEAAAVATVDGCETCSMAALGVGSAVISMNFATGVAKKIDLPAGVIAEDVVVRGDDVFVRDENSAAFHVTVTTGAVEPIEMPGGAPVTDITAVGNNVFLNNGGGAQALAIDADSIQHPIEKYTPASVELAQKQANDPAEDTTATPPTPQPPTPAADTTTPALVPQLTGPTADVVLPNPVTAGGGTTSPPPNSAPPSSAPPTPRTYKIGPLRIEQSSAPGKILVTAAPDPNPSEVITVTVSLMGSDGTPVGNMDVPETAISAEFDAALGCGVTYKANLGGAGELFDSATLTMPCPQTPPDVSISNATQSSLSATWSGPAGWTEPTSYSVEWSSGRSVPTSSDSDTASGLSPDTDYTVTVTAMYGETTGGSASASGATKPTPAPPPPPPSGPWGAAFEEGTYGCAYVRTAPSLGAGQVACVQGGTAATAYCYTEGDSAFGSNIWYRHDQGYTHSAALQINGYPLGSRPPDMPHC